MQMLSCFPVAFDLRGFVLLFGTSILSNNDYSYIGFRTRIFTELSNIVDPWFHLTKIVCVYLFTYFQIFC